MFKSFIFISFLLFSVSSLFAEEKLVCKEGDVACLQKEKALKMQKELKGDLKDIHPSRCKKDDSACIKAENEELKIDMDHKLKGK